MADQPRMSLRDAASELGVSLNVVQRLELTGLLDSSEAPGIASSAVEQLAKRAPLTDSLAAGRRALVVSLGVPRELSVEEREVDGNWRNFVGFHTSWERRVLTDAARGWWRCADPVPELLVAVAPGGFVVGVFRILEMEARLLGGFKRFRLADDPRLDELGNTWVPTKPGPTCFVITSPIP